MNKSLGLLIGVVGVFVAGCNLAGSTATAVAPAEIPEGWAKHPVGSRMTMALPDYLNQDTIPKDSLFEIFAQTGLNDDMLMRTYFGPDAKGRDCMVMMTAWHVPAGGTNPEGAINEMVDMMSGFGATDVETSRRKVELPIGSAWRGVVTVKIGGEAMSTIVYAGKRAGVSTKSTFSRAGRGTWFWSRIRKSWKP